MKKIILVGKIIIFYSYSYSAFEFKNISPYSTSLAGMHLKDEAEAFDIFYNPAQLSNIKQTQVQTAYSELFGISVLAHQTTAVCIPIKKLGNFGIGYNSFGKEEFYKEEIFALSYSRNFSRTFLVGITLKNMRLAIPDFGETNVIGIDFGVSFEPVLNNEFGISLRNFNRPEIGKYVPEEIYSDITFSYKYKILKNLNFNLEGFKIPSYELGTRAGIEFKIQNILALRMGLQNNPSFYTAGFGINQHLIIIDYAFKFHNQLGEEHLVSLGVKF
jgi:hypothetical protein